MGAGPVCLTEVMTVASACIAQTCIIHARDDKLQMLTDEDSLAAQCNKFNSDLTIIVGRYKPPKRLEDQLDCHNDVKRLYKVSKTNWGENFTLLEEYPTYCDKFPTKFTNFKSMWDGHLCSIKGGKR